MNTHSRRSACTAMLFAATSATLVLAAAPAFAANAVNINGVGPSSVEIDYTCDASAGVTSIQAMLGKTTAEAPAATGTQTAVTCDGSQHDTTVALTPAPGESPLQSGDAAQIRVALIDRNEVVVFGSAKAFTVQ
ncbi:hypothetical protein AB0N05_12120 [Nocardia sp. NPDC051030]|uniref:hypothetical protein n=1 Tax=Nocardia sp. NPDC051030 TaxID=3155162 RepID=UPI003440F464